MTCRSKLALTPGYIPQTFPWISKALEQCTVKNAKDLIVFFLTSRASVPMKCSIGPLPATLSKTTSCIITSSISAVELVCSYALRLLLYPRPNVCSERSISCIILIWNSDALMETKSIEACQNDFQTLPNRLKLLSKVPNSHYCHQNRPWRSGRAKIILKILSFRSDVPGGTAQEPSLPLTSLCAAPFSPQVLHHLTWIASLYPSQRAMHWASKRSSSLELHSPQHQA